MKRKLYAGFTGHDVHIDVPLSNVAIAYRPRGFIADQIAPIVPVPKQSNGYYIWDIADAYRIEETFRAPATEANIIEHGVNSATFFCRNYALKDRIPYEDIANADVAYIFAQRGSRAEFIKDKLLLDWERRVALLVNSGSNVGSYSVVASAWTDRRSGYSKPITDMITAIENSEGVTGIRPNKAVFGRYAWRYFRDHADVLDRIFGTAGAPSGGRLVSTQQVADLFELEKVMVGGAYYQTLDEGQAVSLAKIWNDNVLVYYAPDTPRIDDASFMYSFRWPGIAGMDMTAEIFQLERAKAEEVQLGYYQDEKITGSTLGFLITGVGSAQ